MTGGLSSYVRQLGQLLAAEGVTVGMAARFAYGEQPLLYYGASDRPQTLEGAFLPTRIVAPRFGMKPLLRYLSLLLGPKTLRPVGRKLYLSAYGAALRQAIPPGVDIIHYVGTGVEMLGEAALAEARRRGIPFTVLPAVHAGTWGDLPMDTEFYNRANATITLSCFERSYLAERGADAKRLHPIPLAPVTAANGDGTRFRQQHALGMRPLVLFLARRVEYKGYPHLHAALPLVLKAVPDACLVSIGPPDEALSLPASLPPGALLDLGRVSEQEKADALAACDVLCVPSRFESFGLVYVEAWEYGKPVVGGPAPAVRELITEGENGFCVPQEPQAIADALIRLLQDPALRARMGANGRALQQARYTWEAVARAHRAVWETSRA